MYGRFIDFWQRFVYQVIKSIEEFLYLVDEYEEAFLFIVNILTGKKQFWVHLIDSDYLVKCNIDIHTIIKT